MKRVSLARWTLICLASLASYSLMRAAPDGEEHKKFQAFLERVNAYSKLRDSLRAGVPPLRHKDSATQIQMHQQMLAEKIQEARKEAKVGDIITPDSQKAFRQVIDKAFAGRHQRTLNRTIVQGEPIKIALYVNRPYPERIPTTTVPPTLLQHFPKLPKEIKYRIVGEDLVLEDTESQLVIDIYSGAFPNAPPHS